MAGSGNSQHINKRIVVMASNGRNSQGRCNMENAKVLPTADLLEMYPEFKPLWAAAGDNKTLKYYVRLMLLTHHREETA